MNSYLFYDLETTGLNKAFDQVLQFAAIRTDMDFNEIERHSIMVQLRPDVIISPRAIITHRISIADSMKGCCEYDGIKEIHRLMNEAGTISLGYNTLGFDDEFLRFSFYRNLLSPYTHQYANGCRRMDLLPITVIYWLHKREVLSWPELSGRPTLKLEYLSEFNNLAKGLAHNAMVDVEATVELTKRLIKSRETWDYLAAQFEKQTDIKRAARLPLLFSTQSDEYRYGLMTGVKFGAKNQFQSPVLNIGRSIPYKNQTLWLRLDQEKLREITESNIADNSRVIRKRDGEPGILLPPSERYWNKLSIERKKIVEDNSCWLQSNPELFQKIVSYHRQFSYPYIPDLDADAALYQIGFLSREDESLCRRFHDASPEEKVHIATQFSLEETRLLASRLLLRNNIVTSRAEQSDEFGSYMEKVNPASKDNAITDYKGDVRTTPMEALSEISELKINDDLDRQQHQLLEELEDDINGKFPRQKAQGDLF